ncbi:hypothetical protein DSECCO2_645000 [anaerobic digester metagenome]
MDGDGDLPLFQQSERLGGDGVEDLLHLVHLQEMVAGTERTHLGDPALFGFRGDLGGIGVLHAAVLLRTYQVLGPSVALGHRPFRSLLQDAVYLVGGDVHHAFGADPGRDVLEQGVDELLDPGRDIVHREVGGDQPNAAVDIEPYAARGDHSFLSVHGRHPADRESVTPVNVRHGHGPADYARKTGHVRGLLRRIIGDDGPDHLLVGEDDRVPVHALLVGARDLPAIIIDLFQRTVPAHPFHLKLENSCSFPDL